MKARARKPGHAPSAPPSPGDSGARSRAYSPEIVAQLVVARRPTTPSGHRVKLALTLFLPHDVAEYLTARAICEGRNVAGLVAEILAEDRNAMGEAPPGIPTP